MLLGARSVDRVLEAGKVDNEDWRSKLELIGAMRAFAAGQGFAPSRSYTTVNLGFEHVVNVVTACAPDRFDAHSWNFPIVGEVPYKGFFDPQDAERLADRLRDKGLDVSVRAAGAYSTLGWFRDPILPSILDMSLPGYVNTILHESAHASLYINGQGDFNESWASFIGDTAETLFFIDNAERWPDILLRASERRRDRQLYGAFLLDLYDRLDAVYQAGGSREQIMTSKSGIISQALVEYSGLPFANEAWSTLFDERELNNAVIQSARRYGRGMDRLQSAFERCGKTLEEFIKASKSLEKMNGDPWVNLDSLCLLDPTD